MPPAATVSSVLGLGKEVTAGVSVVPTLFLPVKTFGPHDIYNYTPDEGIRGSAVEYYDQIATQAWSEYSFAGDVFVDTIGAVLLGIFGEEAITGAGPYTHTFTLLNTPPLQPPTFSIYDYNGLAARRHPYGVMSGLTLRGNADGLLEFDASALAYKSASASTTASSFTAEVVKAAYTGVISINSVTTGLVQNFDLSISRSVEPMLAINGTQDPYKIWAGSFKMEGQLTIIHEASTFYDFYTAGTKIPIVLTFSLGAGAAQRSIAITMTAGQFNDATVERGAQWVTLNTTIRGIPNTTDVGVSAGYSPGKIQLINSRATIY